MSVELRSTKRLSNTNRTEICVIFVSPSSWYVFYNIIVRKTKGELFDYLRGYICYSDKKSKEGEKEVKMFLKSRKERGWNGLES
jgi:hypothetical protein